VLACPAVAAADQALAPRYAATDHGSVALAGNTLLTCTSGSACTSARNGAAGASGNDDLEMTHVDADGDWLTFNSSRAVLTLPAGAAVLFAGLYWGADTSAGTSGGPAPFSSQRNRVRFAPPGASYQTVTAAVVHSDAAVATRYQGFADVTSQVAAAGSGTYTVGNVQAGTGQNRYGGWGLVVAYRLASAPARRLLVYDG
jgi:hypothetical protein